MTDSRKTAPQRESSFYPACATQGTNGEPCKPKAATALAAPQQPPEHHQRQTQGQPQKRHRGNEMPQPAADSPCEAAQAVRRSDQRHRPKDRRPKGRRSNHLNRWKIFGDARCRNRSSERKENSHRMYTGTRGSLIKPPAQQTIAAEGYTATRCKDVTKCIQEQEDH
jgi:hypothetical protein